MKDFEKWAVHDDYYKVTKSNPIHKILGLLVIIELNLKEVIKNQTFFSQNEN